MSAATTPCPLCGDPLARPMQIDVCGTCFQDLHAAGAVDLHTTGEFAAVARDVKDGAPPPAPRIGRARTAAPAAGEPTCTWCQRPRHEVKLLLASGEARICNECVALCADALESELGADWR